ncbi:4Fe-4S dicluster domain-containing protein [Clostridiisalibacter paucivorans]|uniref:4Fe-4S dicluster domain-containing protein n=1 Tax=Clostridiisalibacter paucivorans TaxID=408753 RepID=UPI000479BA38|nr:4Fe-4S dicluster domain-containing protein [Clostridiisalibacter paucivorans]
MDLLQKIYEAGVVGAGGAGFPTHVKLDCKVEYLIINAAECEPLLNTDKYIMMNRGEEIIKTVEEVGEFVEAKHLIIALKEKYTEEINSLKDIIKRLNSNVELFYLGNYYPAGDEQMMVYEVTGRSIPEAGIPLDVGAVVTNVGTIVNIGEAMKDNPVVDKCITVVGEVNNPTMLKVPVGISVKECIDAAGGTDLNEYAVIIGGPMMGTIIDDNETHKNHIKKTDGSLIILPKDHYIVQRKRKPLQTIINETRSACIQCRYCTDLCHRYLIGHKLRPHKVMRNIGMSEQDEEIMKEALICCECGICELYSCPMGLSPRLVNVYVKGELRKKGIRPEKGSTDIESRDMIEYRKIPTTRLMARLDILKYYNQNIDDIKELFPKEVTIPLSQHIGKPASAVVKVGDNVSKGQLIGKVERNDMGANVHATIDGKVLEVSDKVIIQREDNGVIL